MCEMVVLCVLGEVCVLCLNVVKIIGLSVFIRTL